MAGSGVRRRPVLGLLTTVWITGVAVVLWWLGNLAWEGWAADVGGEDTSAVRSETSVAMLVLVTVAVAGPLVVAVVAWWSGRRRAAAVNGVLAAVLAVVSVPVLVGAARALRPVEPPPPRPTVCQEHSGGDNRCPGG